MNLRLLRGNRNFRLICLTTFISSVGDSLYNLACTLTLYAITGSVAGVAGMWLIRALIRIPGQFFSGILTDRWNRKYLSVAVYLISAVLVLLFLITEGKNLFLAYGLIFLLQGTSDIDNTAQSAMMPEIVKKEELAEANSIFSILGTMISLTAPALGGLLYKLYGAGVLYLTDAATFVAAALLMAGVRYQYHRPEKAEKQKFMLFQYAIEGGRRIWEKQILKLLLLVMMGGAVLGRFYEIYKVYLVDQIFARNAEDIIYFSYAMAVGSFIAPFLVSRFKKQVNSMSGFLWISALSLLSYVWWGNASGMFTCFLANVLIGTYGGVMSIGFQTLYQSEIDNRYLGRALAFHKVCMVFSAILGILAAPLLLNWMGPGMSIAAVSIMLMVVAGILLSNRE